MERLTKIQALEAMSLFLEKYYLRTNSDDLGSLLGDLQILEDGKTADPAVVNDWQDCVSEVLEKNRKSA